MTDVAHDQRRQRLIGIALMCGAVAAFACLDCLAKYLGTRMDVLQVVGARPMWRLPMRWACRIRKRYVGSGPIIAAS